MSVVIMNNKEQKDLRRNIVYYCTRYLQNSEFNNLQKPQHTYGFTNLVSLFN